MGHTVKIVVVALLLHTENDHVCTTVLSKKKNRLFYLSSLLNGEERDYSPLVTGAVSTYTVCATVLSMIKILFFIFRFDTHFYLAQNSEELEN